MTYRDKRKVVLWTSNVGKFEHAGEMLGESCWKLKHITPHKSRAVEEGDSARQNAIRKALVGSLDTPHLLLATDEALTLPGLSRPQPGARVRRVGGGSLTDKQVIDHYWNLLAPPEVARAGIVVTAFWALARTGSLKGVLKTTQRYSVRLPPSRAPLPGRPLSAIHFEERFGRHYCELTPEERMEADRPLASSLLGFLARGGCDRIAQVRSPSPSE